MLKKFIHFYVVIFIDHERVSVVLNDSLNLFPLHLLRCVKVLSLRVDDVLALKPRLEPECERDEALKPRRGLFYGGFGVRVRPIRSRRSTAQAPDFY